MVTNWLPNMGMCGVGVKRWPRTSLDVILTAQDDSTS
jgi:hypothetical protein